MVMPIIPRICAAVIAPAAMKAVLLRRINLSIRSVVVGGRAVSDS
jgi:hypothetical protein